MVMRLRFHKSKEWPGQLSINMFFKKDWFARMMLNRKGFGQIQEYLNKGLK
jgi:hypothetical protein